MLLVMARAMRLTFLDLALLCILFLAAVAFASEVPVATSSIITTVTQTDTQLSTTTIGTSVSTSTLTCTDGSCIAISLISVPIVSTITVLSGSTYVSTIGYTTIYSSVADVVDSTTRVTSLATTTPSASTSAGTTTGASPSPTTTQVFLTTISPTFSPISQAPLSTQTSTSSASASQNNSSNRNSSDREASHNGLSAAAKAAIATVAVLAVSAAIFLAFWLGKRQSRKAAVNVEEAKPDPEEIVPVGIIEKDDDDSSNNSGRSETLGSFAHGRPYEMGATSPTPLGKAAPMIASVKLADGNTAAEQRPITDTQHTLAHANAERKAQLRAAYDSMRHELDVARNRRSGVASVVVELGDGRRSPTQAPAPRAKLVDLDGMIGPRIASRIVDADAGVAVELMGNERFEKG